MRKKTGFIAITILLISLTVNIQAFAEISKTYETAASEWSDVSSYTYHVKVGETDIEVVKTGPVDAVTNVTANVRSLPDTTGDVLATIDAGTKVKVWGITNNNWYKTFCIDKDGKEIFGYMSATLLNDNN